MATPLQILQNISGAGGTVTSLLDRLIGQGSGPSLFEGNVGTGVEAVDSIISSIPAMLTAANSVGLAGAILSYSSKGDTLATRPKSSAV